MRPILIAAAVAIAVSASASEIEKRIVDRTPVWKQMCTEVGLSPRSPRHQLCVVNLKTAYLDGLADAASPADPASKVPTATTCTRSGNEMLCVQMPPY